MQYVVKTTPHFQRDYRRAGRAGEDLGPLDDVIRALAAGEPLPPENRDRPLTGEWSGYRECRVEPGRVLVYHLRGEAPVLTLVRTGAETELYRKGGTMQMKNGLKALYRSPVKTVLTLLLLGLGAFLFLYNLGEYAVSDREYREARDRYEGVLTAEESPVQAKLAMYNDFFLITDPTNPGRTFGEVSYEEYHHEGLHADTVEKLGSLPHISRVERRYMTAGRSPDYYRLDTDQKLFYYAGRCIVTATVDEIYDESLSGGHEDIVNGKYKYRPEVAIGGFQTILLKDIELLAGKEEWLHTGESIPAIDQAFVRDDLRDAYAMTGWVDYPDRRNAYSIDNHLYLEDLANLVPGRRYVFVLRNERDDQYYPIGDRRGNYNIFIMADDTIIDWWPYYTDVTDLPEGWLETEEFAPLRELIQVTNDDLRTFDVVYGDDMSSIRRVSDGRMVCEEGRFITPADAGQPVCVVNRDFLELNGLEIGDTITLDLGNYLCEPFASLGAVASTRGRYSTAWEKQTFTIIGTWRDLNEGNHADKDLYWCWSNNAIFVPAAFLPECVNADTYAPKPNDVSFVVGRPEEILAFEENVLPQLEEMGISFMWNDLGWSLIGKELMTARDLARVKLLVFAGAAVLALVLTVWLFIGRRKREYAIYRALGMPKREASLELYVPFLALGAVAAAAGAVAARVFSLRQIAAAQAEAMDSIAMHTPAGPGLYILGALGFLVFLAAMAWCGILLIRRRSILELLSGNKGPLREGAPAQPVGEKEEYGGLPQAFCASSLKEGAFLGGSRGKNWRGRYLRRLLGRNLGRSALSLILAALLVFAFGTLTVLRSIYRELYQNVEVKPVISGGLDYKRALKIEESGYVRDPYYEFVCKDAAVEMEPTEIIMTNRLNRRVSLPIVWQEGMDEETMMNSDERYCVITKGFADSVGLGLGDKIRVNEENDWWNHLSQFGLDPLKPGETVMERRDARRPFMEIAGLIQTDTLDRTTYIAVRTWNRYNFLYSEARFGLDMAEYTLLDYHKAAEFADYAKQVISRTENNAKFRMDTSYADQIYKIHRLIESLYPLAIAAALLLGGVLPGLIVLHGSKEISILRALGVRARECVVLYTLSQVLCALAGLVLGIALVIVLQNPERSGVVVPFALYVSAHLAACALGSGVFAWLCARKRVLEQLQAKE